MNKALFTNNKNDWCTPEVVLSRVRQVGPIVLDPCSNNDSIVNASNTLDGSTPEQDGLKADWSSYKGLIYSNPPYKGIRFWTKKAKEEASKGCEIIMLIPARPDTKWFQNVIDAKEMCFWKGRIKFVGAKSRLATHCSLL